MKIFLLLVIFSINLSAHDKGLTHSHVTDTKSGDNFLKIEIPEGPRFRMKTNFAGCLSTLCEIYGKTYDVKKLIKSINPRGEDKSQDIEIAFKEAEKLGFEFKKLNIGRDIHKNWVRGYNKKYETDIDDPIKFLKRKPDKDKILLSLNDRDSSLSKFRKTVIKELKAGKLILWHNISAVTTNYMKHPEECFRIINGYNSITDELLFFDSWGDLRKDKLLSFKNAFLITIEIYSIKSSR